MTEPLCDDCNDEGWVWDDEEGGSYDCACLGDVAIVMARARRANRQRFHSEAHNDPEDWSDCQRCLDLYQQAERQLFHDQRHEPGHPLPMRWQDCQRCADLEAVLS